MSDETTSPGATEGAQLVRLPTGADIKDLPADLIRQEHEQRHREIQSVVARMESDEKYALLLSGVVWSWLAANQEKLRSAQSFGTVIAWIPFAFMVLFFFRWCGWDRGIKRNAEYVKLLERMGGLHPLGLGWERWLADKHVKSHLPAFWFWVILTVANGAVAFLVTCS